MPGGENWKFSTKTALDTEVVHVYNYGNEKIVPARGNRREKEEAREMRQVHTFAPVYDEASEVLILGSFPSVKSREEGFYYGHPQNRFWKLLSILYGAGEPRTVEEKKEFLIARHIALWDVIQSCDITGSGDASIRGAVPNDLTPIFEAARIRRVFANGRTAEALYRRMLLPRCGREITGLPSTSPANAAYTMERLLAAWREVRDT